MSDQFFEWQTQAAWYQQEGRGLFKTRTQWDWFFRKHREVLTNSRAIGRVGRQVVVHSERIKPVLDRLIVLDAQRGHSQSMHSPREAHDHA